MSRYNVVHNTPVRGEQGADGRSSAGPEGPMTDLAECIYGMPTATLITGRIDMRDASGSYGHGWEAMVSVDGQCHLSFDVGHVVCLLSSGSADFAQTLVDDQRALFEAREACSIDFVAVVVL
ncbi:hypothetical protein ml_376 [Mollivirus sibericum]|uniref:hypothetical protein n=1 Tax=Mollivirus sibericum TaxID=1678078 RepID=UPI0006B2EA68|nr:hypothetical protein ml_376 [Mollivirus sibericum]ALD62178.1 hypothetical protein ml_376 [Mollivirus sibericum]